MPNVMTMPKTLALAALLGLPACDAFPQFQSCYDMSEYKTTNTKDVSKWKWWGTSADICQAPCELASTEVEGQSYAYSWTVGGGADITDAISAGLTFGMEIATYEEKGTVRNIQCPESDNPDAECHCGFQYKVQEEEASGVEIISTRPESCKENKHEEPFAIVAPVKNSQGIINVDWEQCRSSKTKNCPEYDKYEPCPDGR